MGLVGPWVPGNCFADNLHAATNTPILLELFHSCDGINLPVLYDPQTLFYLLGAQGDAAHDVPEGSDYTTFPTPGPQPNMPDVTATPEPAVDVFEKPDLDAVRVPELPAGTEIRGKEVTVSGVPVSEPTVWTVLFGLYAYFLPLVLVATWFALAVWDIVRRQDELAKGPTIAWIAVIFLVPFFGVIGYLTFGKPRIAGWLRLLLVGGGILAWLVILVILMITSGAV